MGTKRFKHVLVCRFSIFANFVIFAVKIELRRASALASQDSQRSIAA